MEYCIVLARRVIRFEDGRRPKEGDRNEGDFGVTICVLLRVRTNQWSSCWHIVETIGTIWKSFGSIPHSMHELETGDFSSMVLCRIHSAVVSPWYP